MEAHIGSPVGGPHSLGEIRGAAAVGKASAAARNFLRVPSAPRAPVAMALTQAPRTTNTLMRSFLLSLMPFIPSILLSFMPFLPTILPSLMSFLPSFFVALPSLFPSFLHSFHPPFLLSFLPSFFDPTSLPPFLCK